MSLRKFSAAIALLCFNLNLSPQLSNAFTPSSSLSSAFSASFRIGTHTRKPNTKNVVVHRRMSSDQSDSKSEAWNGEVVSNSEDGVIKGCSITKVEGSISEWKIEIDGIEADLGKFSDAIYRKISSDVKQQRFQGFRPGTIPPHLVPMYIGFAMDECAREATLESMSQNNIRPFDDARTEITFDTISILPPQKKGKKKKSKKRKKNNNSTEQQDSLPLEESQPQWLVFETMKEAIDAGWKPGQSFSFVARNVKGQQLNDKATTGAKAIGAGGSALDLNTIQFDGE